MPEKIDIWSFVEKWQSMRKKEADFDIGNNLDKSAEMRMQRDGLLLDPDAYEREIQKIKSRDSNYYIERERAY